MHRARGGSCWRVCRCARGAAPNLAQGKVGRLRCPVPKVARAAHRWRCEPVGVGALGGVLGRAPTWAGARMRLGLRLWRGRCPLPAGKAWAGVVRTMRALPRSYQCKSGGRPQPRRCAPACVRSQAVVGPPARGSQLTRLVPRSCAMRAKGVSDHCVALVFSPWDFRVEVGRNIGRFRRDL